MFNKQEYVNNKMPIFNWTPMKVCKTCGKLTKDLSKCCKIIN